MEHAGVQVRAGGVGVNVDREQVDRAGNDAQQPPRRRVRDGLLGGRPVRFVLPAGREWALALVAEHQVRVGVYERLDRLAGKLACRRSHRQLARLLARWIPSP